MEFFVHDPALLQLAAEIGQALRSGRMGYKEAVEVMKTAVRRSFREKAIVLRGGESS